MIQRFPTVPCLALLPLLTACTDSERDQSAEADATEQSPSPGEIAAERERLAARERARTRTEPGVQHPISQFEIERLQKRGLRDPVPDLVASLIAHPEIIPVPGRPGTPMKFYEPSRIRVLNERWVYAAFDDGHTSGFGVFEFTVLNPTRAPS
jgi:hypothetical protein